MPAGWILFTLMVMGISRAGYAMRGEMTVGFMQNLGLLLCGAVTFLVVNLARRWPIGRRNLIRTACAHVGFGVAVVAGHVGEEYGLSHAFGAQTMYWELFAYQASLWHAAT